MSFISQHNWTAWLSQAALALFLIFIFWRAAIQWLFKLQWILCNPRANLTCMQTCKIIFSSIDEAFNPLSLTRADFKAKIRGIGTKLERLNTNAATQQLLTKTLVAQTCYLQ